MKKIILVLTLLTLSLSPTPQTKAIGTASIIKAGFGVALLAGGGVCTYLSISNGKKYSKKITRLKKYLEKFKKIKEKEESIGLTDEEQEKKEILHEKFKIEFSDELEQIDSETINIAEIKKVLEKGQGSSSIATVGSLIVTGIGVLLLVWTVADYVKEKREEERRNTPKKTPVQIKKEEIIELEIPDLLSNAGSGSKNYGDLYYSEISAEEAKQVRAQLEKIISEAGVNFSEKDKKEMWKEMDDVLKGQLKKRKESINKRKAEFTAKGYETKTYDRKIKKIDKQLENIKTGKVSKVIPKKIESKVEELLKNNGLGDTIEWKDLKKGMTQQTLDGLKAIPKFDDLSEKEKKDTFEVLKGELKEKLSEVREDLEGCAWYAKRKRDEKIKIIDEELKKLK